MAGVTTPADEQPSPAVFWRWVWSSVRPVLGYVFIGFGLLLILFGYLGVSREVFVGRQLPYVISGGLFGVAFVTLGSRLLMIEDLRRDSGRLDRLERAVLDLHQALLNRPDAPGPDAYAGANGRVSAASERLLTVAGGESFHRADCPIVEGKASPRAVTPATAKRKGLRPCPMCQPLTAGV
jgi:hypothetical protein